MKYIISKPLPKRPTEKSEIVSWDEKVISASPVFKWAIGEPITNILEVLRGHGWTIEIHE